MSKRVHKGAARARQEVDERKARIAKVVEAVKASDPTLKHKLLERAINHWSEKYYRECRLKKKAYPFPDPLKVLEYLVAPKAEHIQAEPVSADAIIATALFAYVSPAPGKDFDRQALIKIQGTFGINVRDILTGAIRLDSFKILSRPEGDEQTQKGQFKLALKAALEIAKKKESVELRAAFRVVELKERFENAAKASCSHDELCRDLPEIRNIVAPAAHWAGYEWLSYDLLDYALRLDDPARHERALKGVQTLQAMYGEVTPEKLEGARHIIIEEAAQALTHSRGMSVDEARDVIDVEIRPKSADSIDKKAKKKEQDYSQLGDGWGFSVTFSDTVGAPADYDFYKYKASKTHQKAFRDHMARLGDVALDIYHHFSQRYGRDSDDPVLRNLFKILADVDPHEEIPGLDARFDNYIHKFKPIEKAEENVGILPHGYSGAQDTVMINGIIFEAKFYDERRRENNKYHKFTGDVAYKTGLPQTQTFPTGIIVYDENNLLIELGSEATAYDFARKIYEHNPQFMPLSPQVFLTNNDPLIARDSKIPYHAAVRLVSGDKVILKPALTQG